MEFSRGMEGGGGGKKQKNHPLGSMDIFKCMTQPYSAASQNTVADLNYTEIKISWNQNHFQLEWQCISHETSIGAAIKI